jgi:hypothetical protein
MPGFGMFSCSQFIHNLFTKNSQNVLDLLKSARLDRGRAVEIKWEIVNF